jgi:hypothetical protein
MKNLRLSVMFTFALTIFILPHVSFGTTTPAGLDTTLETLSQGGTTYMFGTGGDDLSETSVTNMDFGGNFFYSDDPETVTAYGIMYQDTFPPETSRIYLYHVNGISTTSKITIVGSNVSSSTATITLMQRAVEKPSGSYTSVGEQASYDYLTSTTSLTVFTVPPNTTFILDSTLETSTYKVSHNSLLHAIYDVYSNQSVQYSTCMLSTTSNTLSTFGSLTILADDGLGRRGTYPTRDRTKTLNSVLNTASGMFQMTIAENIGETPVVDPPLVGTNALTLSAVTLEGNYGVFYNINIPIVSSDGQKMALLMVPQGGAYAGAFQATAGVTPGAVFKAPTIGPIGTSGSSTGALLAEYSLVTNSTTTVQLQFIPAGAMSLPIEIVFAPYTLNVIGPQTLGQVWLVSTTLAASSGPWTVSTAIVLMDTGNFTRGLDISTSEGLLVVPSHGTNLIYVMNASDAQTTGNGYLGTGSLDTTQFENVGSPNFFINKVKVAADGVIYGCGLNTNINTGYLPIYRWSSTTAAGTLAALIGNPQPAGIPGTIGTNNRFGDSLGVDGSGINTEIYVGGTHCDSILKFTTVDGINFTLTSIITTSAEGIGGNDIDAVSVNGNLWTCGPSDTQPTQLVTQAGLSIDTINTGVIASSEAVSMIANVTGTWSGTSTYVLKTDGSTGGNLYGRMANVTSGGTNTTLDFITPVIGNITNGNGTGAATYDGNGYVYFLNTDNGIGKYSVPGFESTPVELWNFMAR